MLVVVGRQGRSRSLDYGSEETLMNRQLAYRC